MIDLQCADLTLSSEINSIEGVDCTNSTTEGDHHGTGGEDHGDDHEHAEGEEHEDGEDTAADAGGAAVSSFRGTWAALGAAAASGVAVLLL